MSDGEFRLCRHQGGLGSDSAGPEDRLFARGDWYGVAEVRAVQICDTDLFRSADVDWCSVNVGKLRRDLYRSRRVRRV